MTCTKIAIVEAQKAIRDRFRRFLEEEGCQVEYLAPSDGLVKSIASSGCDLVIAAENMSGFAPVELISQLRDQCFKEPVAIVANEAAVGPAVEAIRAGAMEVIFLSYDNVKLYKILDNIEKAKQKKESEATGKRKESYMVAEADNMQRLLDMVKRIAPSSATVLIQGESGTGKEVMARYIHQNSGRGNCPFVAMNCAALPENLAESELFGYEKGAFTGALTKKQGRFEQAQGGTLLLDEISEMPLPLQAKLLRVLQEKEVDRIGGKGTVSVDVRIIATTNRDLAEMVKEGQFRKDLYYRLRIIPLVIPALRERRQDITALIDHFILKYSPTSKNRLPKFSHEAR